jgi:ABC-type polysaccharide/polyol phosphate export permease
MHLAARGSFASEMQGAARDFSRSFSGARIWRVLAMNDILARYRGSLLGPFWITLTQAAFIFGIGVLYSQLFKVPINDYIPLLANGVILWTLFSGIILEGCDAFIYSSNIIKQTSLPLPSFLWRVVTRNLIIFAHQALVILAVAIYFGFLLKIQIWWAVLGLALCVVNVSWMALILGVVCTRFRDMPQVVTALMQMLFFLTPVLWDPSQAPRAAAIMQFNPFSHMLEVTRAPLLGRTPSVESFVVLLVLGLLGWAAAFGIFAAVRRRVVHYL